MANSRPVPKYKRYSSPAIFEGREVLREVYSDENYVSPYERMKRRLAGLDEPQDESVAECVPAMMAVCGSRNGRLSDYSLGRLAGLVEEYGVDHVIAGDARGVDAEALNWAKERGLKTTMFIADWDQHGKAAGPIRNKDIAKALRNHYGFAFLVAFPGGRGTESMKEKARENGIMVISISVEGT